MEGRKGSRIGPELNYSIVPMTVFTSTTGRSGARMTRESFPESGLEGQNFFFHVSQSFDVGHPGYHCGPGESLPLSLTFEGTDS